MRSAVFLDRDGVLCKDKNIFYKGKPVTMDNFDMEEDSVEGLRYISSRDYLIFLITNQSAIGRGITTEEEFQRVNRKIEELAGIKFNGIYYCPHKKEDNCRCRKPKIEMLLRAKREFMIDLENSYVIGDKTSDIKMGVDAGCKTILVKTGYGGRDDTCLVKPDSVIKTLKDISIVIK